MKIWNDMRYHTIGDHRMALNRIGRRLQYEEAALDRLARADLLSQCWVEAYRARRVNGAPEKESPTPLEVYTMLLRELQELFRVDSDDKDLQDDIRTVERYLRELHWHIVNGEIRMRPKRAAVK